MSRPNDAGNGDLCPLFPEHGKMTVLDSGPGHRAPKQWCPHQMHDGGVGKAPSPPASRSLWPLYGFEGSVSTYFARLDKAIREAGLPDLSDLEVLP